MTRAELEQVIVHAFNGFLVAAGLDVTHAGANPDLAGPIAQALLELGYSVANPANPTTAEVEAVVAADLAALIEFAKIFTLQAIIGNWVKVDVTQGPRSVKYSQTFTFINTLKDELTAHATLVFGFGAKALEAGIYDVSTAQVEED